MAKRDTPSSSGRRVLAGGVFDLLHPGHVAFLEEAKRLAGEDGELIVVVARDETVRRFKRTPIVPEEQRVRMVEALKPVDRAVLGHPSDFSVTLERVRPDVVVLGPDQEIGEEDVRRWAERAGVECEVVRIRRYEECPLDSTVKIVRRVIELWRRGELEV
ncbi:MAG: adenylyltransferase/cytidyltransferase family protein [Euryarchaeota archaeon]